MSKSKGEFLTVSLLEQKGYDPLAYRYFCLQSHYRKALVFTWENLDNAAAAYTKLIARIAALDPADGPVDQEAMKPYREKFGQQMGNDLNTSMGVTALFDVLKTKTNDATKLALIGDFDSVLSLGLLVFGNMIQAFMVSRFPIIADVTTHIINFRALWALMILIIFFLGIYTFVPDKRLKLRDQLPGAVFSTVGWMAFSFAFSLYFSHIGGKNYSYMYGSLTAIVLLLLWLYFCMCILFFGAEINYFWKELFPGETKE